MFLLTVDLYEGLPSSRKDTRLFRTKIFITFLLFVENFIIPALSGYGKN